MDLIVKYWSVLVSGATTTLLLFSIISVIGVSLGVVLGHIQYFSSKVTRQAISIIGLLIVSCPILVLLHWAYFPLQVEWTYKLSPFWTSAVVLALLNAIMVMDVTYKGIESIPKSYLSLKTMYAIPDWIFLRSIWFPTLFVITLHSILLVELSMLHATLFAALIGAEELFRSVLRINSVEINGTAVFSVMAFAFIIVSLPVHLASNRARMTAKKIMGQEGT